MSLTGKVEQDLIAAMKSKDVVKTSVLRMVKAAFGNFAIEKKKNNLDDAEALTVLQKQAKQRRESLESYEKAGRPDLAEKEKNELSILQNYLPTELSDEEIKKFALEAIATAGAKTKADMGKVMKELMPRVKGKADGKRVNEILAQLLS